MGVNLIKDETLDAIQQSVYEWDSLQVVDSDTATASSLTRGKSGTTLTIAQKAGGGIPMGSNINDTLYWDGSAWAILAAPNTSGTWVMGVVDGTIQWLDTSGC